MYKLAPIVLFVYNRLDHTVQTIDSLKRNALSKESDLIIYSDAAKSASEKKGVDLVRKFITEIDGFKSIKIIFRNVNFGVDRSIIDGVSSVIERHEKIIVLEDDLITSVDFIDYMNRALEHYKDNKKIFSITGVSYPINIPSTYVKDVYLGHRCASWSWATWRDRWKKLDSEIDSTEYHEFITNKNAVSKFNLGGDDMSDTLTARAKSRILTWDILWCFAHFKNNAYCLYPVKSKVSNIGLDGSGVHCTKEALKFYTKTSNNHIVFPKEIDIDERITINLKELYRYSAFLRIKKIIKNFIGY